MSKTTVVNIRTTPCQVFIGRPSKFGNPFKIGRDGNREQVIKKFKKYFCQRLKNDPAFKKSVQNLIDVETIGCYCAPEPCHGDIIRDYLYSVKHAGSHACPVCQATMELSGVDVYKCPWCGEVIDICEEEEL